METLRRPVRPCELYIAHAPAGNETRHADSNMRNEVLVPTLKSLEK